MRTNPFMRRWVLAVAISLLAAGRGWAAQKYDVRGLVLKVDPPHHSMVVSCESIPGYMEAMAMPFAVRESGMLDGLKPGSAVEFTLVVEDGSSYAENVRTRAFESLELDPTQARRMRLLEKVVTPGSSSGALAVGQPVPDFTLTDQRRRQVKLSQFAGKVVAVTFVYTRCPFPNYCFRLSNNFGQLQKRFREQMGRDLVLLTIVIDPANDGPAALTSYGQIWKADSDAWHFLTGPLPAIQQISRSFDMNFYPDEALLVHSFHTAVIDRQSRLAANLEGNEFTARQLGDLVQTLVDQRN
jgi:protein SCO1